MTSRVSRSVNLFDYFHDRVRDAQLDVPVELSEDTSLYLASLMSERVRVDRPAPPEQTLAELHARAATANPAAKARTYRELGDRSLYLAGYFRESLSRSTVGPSYYAEMGSAAYYQVDQLFKRWFANAFGPVFAELADRFRDCVEILGNIRRREEEQPDEVERLYRHWLVTQSEDSAAKLRALGILLPRTGGPDDATH